MKFLAFVTTALVFAGLIAGHALAAHSGTPVAESKAIVLAAVKKKCRSGSRWDRGIRRCVPATPRGSF